MLKKGDQFPDTRWSLVLGASSASGRHEALRWLCEHYWYPLYAYIRRRGYPVATAQDLTQGFLAHFLEHRAIESADPARGRFRSYILGALRHYLLDHHDFENAVKRGGAALHVPIEFEESELRYLQSPPHLSPEALYERQWAVSLIERVVGLMSAEHASQGKSAQFDALKPFLAGEGDYRTAALSLGVSEGAVRVSVHRLRRRYRDLLTAEIEQTVAPDTDIDQELRHLLAALAH